MHEVYAFERLACNALDLVKGKAIVTITFDEFVKAFSKCLENHTSVLALLIVAMLIVSTIITIRPYIRLFLVFSMSETLIH